MASGWNRLGCDFPLVVSWLHGVLKFYSRVLMYLSFLGCPLHVIFCSRFVLYPRLPTTILIFFLLFDYRSCWTPGLWFSRIDDSHWTKYLLCMIAVILHALSIHISIIPLSFMLTIIDNILVAALFLFFLDLKRYPSKYIAVFRTFLYYTLFSVLSAYRLFALIWYWYQSSISTI